MTDPIYSLATVSPEGEATVETLYKALGEEGRPFHGGSGLWSLPQGDEPGDWMPPIYGKLRPCHNGYHLCTLDQFLSHWMGPTLYEAEYRGELVDGGDKLVVREARLLRRLPWDDRTARLFACDCAQHVIKYVGDDPRPLEAIEVARRYARGEASAEETALAWWAAWAAFQAIPYDAEGAAAREAAFVVAGGPVWGAARKAAFAATLEAGFHLAAEAERAWQLHLLRAYLYPTGPQS